MMTAERFLFNRDFDPDLLVNDGSAARGRKAGAKPTKARPAPVFTEDDLARARAEGVAEGREQASRDAARSLEMRLTQAFETVGERLHDVLAGRDAANLAIAGQANALAVAIARRMVPELYRRNAAGEIEHTVASVLSRILETDRLAVRTAETLADPLRDRIEALAEARGLGGRIAIVADPSLAEGDCRIEWPGGGAERNEAAMWAEIDAIVEKNLGFVPALAGGENNPAAVNEENTTPMLECSAGSAPVGTEVGENHG